MTRTLLALLLLTGCAGSDFNLQVAPPPVAEGVEAHPAPSLDGPDGGPSTGAAPSIWDGLADLEIPEEYWFVTWAPRSGPCEGDTCWQQRFSAIDVLGRVVASFEHPMWTEDDQALGADDFDVVDAVAGPEGTALITEAPRTSSSASVDHLRYVWRADAVTGAAEWILAVDPDGTLHLPNHAGKFALEAWLQDVRVVPDPTDPDVVWMLALTSIYYGLDGMVVRIPLDGGEPTSWSLGKTLEANLTRVFAMDAVATEDGTALVLGLDGVFAEDEASEVRSRMITFDERGHRLGQDLDLTSELWFDHAVIAEGTTSLENLSVLQETAGSVYGGAYCGSEPMRLVRRDGVVEIAPEVEGCFGTGLLLDATGPTLLVGSHPTPGNYYVPFASEILVHHRGEIVHRLDTFRTGLANNGFELIRMARLRVPEN